jgi:hypothetical protein
VLPGAPDTEVRRSLPWRLDVPVIMLGAKIAPPPIP